MKTAGTAQVLWGLLGAAVCFFSVSSAVAQTVTGSILGTVRDQQGAVIPNATVTAKSVETGAERSAVSDASGRFSIVSVSAGGYDVTASATGFQTQVHSGVTMTVGAAVRVDFTLNVGAVSEKVEVTGEAPQVDTTTSTMSGLVGETAVRELPLNGRDWLQLGALQAGVLTIGSTGSGSVSQGMGLKLSIGGGRPSHNAYRIDGLIVNDHTNFSPGNVMGANLGVDSIREFSVLTNTYSAEYGRSAGGVVNAITKSGTNQIHGTAFEFLRNSDLDARNFFEVSRAPLPTHPAPFRRNQFGGSIGGPIKKDKLFYFANYEGLRQFLAQTASNVQTLSADARNGLLCSNSACTSKTQVTIDPRIKPYLPLFPLPTGPASGDTGPFLLPIGQQGKEDFVTGRMDYQLSSNSSLAGTYSFDNTNLSVPDPFDEKLLATRSRNQRVSLSLQHIFSPTVLNTLRGGVTRTAAAANLDSSPINPLLADPSLGFIPGKNVGTVSVPGLQTFSGIGASGSDIFWYTAPQLMDDLSWVKGKNSIRLGFSIEAIRDNVSGLNNPAGFWQFGSIQSFLTLSSPPQQFNSDFPGTAAYKGQRTKMFGFYVQDDIRLRPNFTLNVGLRYEPATAISEVNNQASNLRNITDPIYTIGNPLFGNPTLKTFMPRIGFAWDPTGSGKTSIRAAGGFYDPATTPNITNNRVIRAAPFYESGTITPNDHPEIASLFPNRAFALESLTTLTMVYMEHNPPMPVSYHWDLNIQRQLTRGMSITVGYIGSRSVHLPTQTNDADQVPQYLLTIAPNGRLQFPTTGPIQRINPNFGQIQTQEWYGWSRYNGLTVNLTQRMSHGLTFQAAYSWSKSMDIGAIEYSSSALPNAMDNPYAFKPELNRGVSDFDVPQHLSANFMWDAPSPATKMMVPRFLLSGWEMGGIFTIQSGSPFNVRLPNDQARTGSTAAGRSQAGQRPDYVAAAGCSPDAVNKGIGNPYQYVKTQCFAFPALGQLGNFGRNVLRGPGLENFDFSIFKNHNLMGERLKVQFRAELFNLFNKPNFQYRLITAFTSSGALVPSNFAPSSPTVTTSRQIQFGLKFVF